MKTIRNLIMAVMPVLICACLSACSKDDDKDTSSKETILNGHAYVDLGLSVKWATCNIGASSPELYGDYYFWGATSKTKPYDACLWGDKTINDIAGTKYDVAHVQWGSSWRLPTQKEAEELMACKWEFTTLNGNVGYKVTGKNGNSIFLPPAGMLTSNNDHEIRDMFGVGTEGKYMTSITTNDDGLHCSILRYNVGASRFIERNPKDRGVSVRPVCP